MYYRNLALSLKKEMTTIPIVVPSYQRPRAPVLKWLAETPSIIAYVFVRKEEQSNYHKLWGKFKNIRIVSITNVSNIGETRATIMEWCLKHKIPRVFQIDDDVTGIDYLYEYTGSSGKTYMRPAHLNDGFKLFGANPVALRIWEEQIRCIEKETHHELAFSSIPLRPFSWSIPSSPYRLNKDIPIQCIYINYALLDKHGIGYQSNDYCGWEDLAIAVEARRKGLNMAHIYGLTYNSPPMGHNSGGCNGDDPDETCWNRSKKLSETFMKNIANGDPALYIKELPKSSLVCVRCHWDKLKLGDNT